MFIINLLSITIFKKSNKNIWLRSPIKQMIIWLMKGNKLGILFQMKTMPMIYMQVPVIIVYHLFLINKSYVVNLNLFFENWYDFLQPEMALKQTTPET